MFRIVFVVINLENTSIGIPENKSCSVSKAASKKRILPSMSSGTGKKIKIDNGTAFSANKAIAAKKLATLEKKISTGEANNNFRRIDIQKKVYCRGKKHITFSKYKKKQWKELKGLDSSGVIKCFKCGDVGHMARQCKGESFVNILICVIFLVVIF